MPPSPADTATTSSPRHLTLLLLIAGAAGLIMSATLLIEKIALIENPDYVPSCSINPILSCGNVMKTSQAEAFGFPNPIIGVAGFAVVVTTGAALASGASLRRWYWLGLQGGVTFAIAFVHWLIYQSLYRIGALCPYCMVVWVVTIPLFLYVTLHNLRATRPSTPRPLRGIAAFAIEYHGLILTIWYLTITGLITKRFWDYWVTLLP